MALTFSEAAGRFVNERGQFVSDAAVRRVVDSIAEQASGRMVAASERLLAGELSLASWQAEMQQAIKVAHASGAVIAHGGAARMTFSRWGEIGSLVKTEYQFLRDFAAQIADGRQPLNGTIRTRAVLFGQATRATFSKLYGEDQRDRGYLSERNMLRSGESCAGCRSESARGWVPTGSLVPIGSRRPCLRNCKCVIQHRREPAEAAA